ncbi:unnamed protein product [Clonostachys rhizophaga]|uniref:Noranthrone monooxygenase n=1 Tax=Clonostachys rhizophaga TaxID=160324 RepID=A0A9N9VXE3_9HYPO|nr:unnamed protein product [Clonostachys rhizophaga]
MSFVATPPPGALAAVATGVIGAGWLSGTIANFSIIGMPTAQSIPQSALEIWHGMFTRGMAAMPKVAGTVALAYAYAAYDSHSRGASWKGYLTAAALVVSIVPFTIVFMTPTNNTLLAAVSGQSVLSQATLSELIQKWSFLNITRSFLPLLGAATGFVSFLRN